MQKSRTSLPLAMVAIALAGCHSAISPLAPHSGMPSGVAGAGKKPFKFEIAERGLASASGSESVTFDGQTQQVESGQILFNLKNGTNIDTLLTKYDLRLIRQIKIPSHPLANRDGKEIPEPVTFIDTPYYLVEAANLESEDLSDLTQMADARDLGGNYRFSSRATAGLFRRLLRLHLDRATKDGETASLNGILEPMATTTEGKACSSGCSFETSPGAIIFWQTGLGAGGADYHNTWNPPSSDSWGLTVASGIKVAVIDSGFISGGGGSNEWYNAS